MLKEILIPEFRNSAGTVQRISLTYQSFGPVPGEAPVVLVTHALTGNSLVTGEKGWWKELVGPGKSIDTAVYSVICFNIPGNGYDGKPENLLHNYTEFTLQDIARILAAGLEKLGVERLFAAIGGSIGGALIWELAVLKPNLIENIIPVATDHKATDWVLGLCKVQDQILNNSVSPVSDARQHAMTFYRTPQSFREKFNRAKCEDGNEFRVHKWLDYHGEKLENRFCLASYKLLNHLLTTIDISRGTEDHLSAAAKIEGRIHIITVNTDLFFVPEENWDTYVALSQLKENVSIHEIRSIHGHDAFLIENSQIKSFLKPIFQPKQHYYEENTHRPVWDR